MNQPFAAADGGMLDALLNDCRKAQEPSRPSPVAAHDSSVLKHAGDELVQNLAKTIGAIHNPGAVSEGVLELRIADIEVPPQVRRTFHPEEISELAGSIRQHGLLTPITVVRRQGQGRPYELLCGGKRLKACQEAGLSTIRASVYSLRDPEGLDERSHMAVLQIIENLQRSDPDLEDFVAAVASLRPTEGKMTVERLASLISKSPAYVSVLLKLCDLSQEEQRVLLPLGFRAARDLWMPLSRREPGMAAKFIERGTARYEDAAHDPSTGTLAPGEEQRVAAENRADLEKTCRKLAAEGGKAPAAAAPRKSVSVSFRKLNRMVKGLGDELEAYLAQSGLGAEEVLASAIEAYLASHKAGQP